MTYQKSGDYYVADSSIEITFGSDSKYSRGFQIAPNRTSNCNLLKQEMSASHDTVSQKKVIKLLNII